MRKWLIGLLLVVIFLVAGFFLLFQTGPGNQQSLSTSEPAPTPALSSAPSTLPTPTESPTPSQPPIEVSESPTPSQTPKLPVKKSTQPKVKVTYKATPKAKVSKSPTPTLTPTPSPSSSSRYPRMRGDVVPINYTNKPYTAGIDIPVGLYHSTGTECGYRIRRVDKSLFNVSIYWKGSTLVEIYEGEQVLNSDCSITFGPPTFQDVLLPGSHLVGVDIEPGIYHAENNLSCTFALGTREEITRGNETLKMGFGNLNGVRDMLIPADAGGVFFYFQCGVLTKVG